MRRALDGDVWQPKLALGSVAHRVDYDDPRRGCSDNGLRRDEDTSPIRNAKPSSVEPDRDSDLYNWIDWTDIGHAARNRVRDLGSGVFVAWRRRLANRRLALFHRLDGHARRIRTNAATTLAADGWSGGSQWDDTVRCEHGVRFRGDAAVLVNARQVRDPERWLTGEGINHTMSGNRDTRRTGPILMLQSEDRTFWGVHEHRYRQTFFGNALLYKLPFKVGQHGFEHVLLTINVRLMYAQLNSPCFHNGNPSNAF